MFALSTLWGGSPDCPAPWLCKQVSVRRESVRLVDVLLFEDCSNGPTRNLEMTVTTRRAPYRRKAWVKWDAAWRHRGALLSPPHCHTFVGTLASQPVSNVSHPRDGDPKNLFWGKKLIVWMISYSFTHRDRVFLESYLIPDMNFCWNICSFF
jgi:hypothetical protein